MRSASNSSSDSESGCRKRSRSGTGVDTASALSPSSDPLAACLADTTCVQISNANSTEVQTVATEDKHLSGALKGPGGAEAACENGSLDHYSRCDGDEQSDDDGNDNTNAMTPKADASCELQRAPSPAPREDTAKANTGGLWSETSEFMELDRVYSGAKHMRLLCVNSAIAVGSDGRFFVVEQQRQEVVWVSDADSDKNFRTFQETMRCWGLLDNTTKKNLVGDGAGRWTHTPDRARAAKRKNEAKDESGKKRLRVAVDGRSDAGQPLRAPSKGSFREDRANDTAAYKEHGASWGARRCYGQIVQWYKEKGYGFVKGEDGQNSIFLHISNVNTGQRSLRTDDEILYDKLFDNKNQKYTAVNASMVERHNSQATQNSRLHCQDRASPDPRSGAEYAPYASEYSRRDSTALVARGGPYRTQDHAESRFQGCDWQDDMAEVFERDDHRLSNRRIHKHMRATYDRLTLNGISSILLCAVNMFVILRYVFLAHQILP